MRHGIAFCSVRCRDAYTFECNGDPVGSVLFDKGLNEYRKETRAHGFSPRKR